MKRSTRAFTLVELIIVIAVIGVLAAILIPTFANVIDKANVASKTSLARNLNSLLATEEVNNGMARTGSMGEAISIAKAHGYTMTELDDETAGEIVFVDGRFAVLDNKGEVAYSETGEVLSTDTHNMFKAYTEMPEDHTYGIYMAGEMSGDVTVDTSFDAGENADININFATDEAGTFTINSNGGNVTVDAPNATVKHYGTADMVIINAVATESYHEFGFVGCVQIACGRFVAEVGASISALIVTGTPVTLANMTPNCAACNVYVKEGVDTAQITYVNSKPIIGDALTQNGIERIMSTATMFGGGSGTKDDPYIITSAKHFNNIATIIDYDNPTYTYYEVPKTVKKINVATTGKVSIYGQFDGNGVMFTGVTNHELFNIVGIEGKKITVLKNFDVTANLNDIAYHGSAVVRTAYGDLLIENVDCYGYVQASCAASYITYGPNNWDDQPRGIKCTFKDCVSHLQLVATGETCAGFVAHPYCKYSDPDAVTYTFDNSKFVGKMSRTGTKATYYFYGMQNHCVPTVCIGDTGEHGTPTKYVDAAKGIFYPDNGANMYLASHNISSYTSGKITDVEKYGVISAAAPEGTVKAKAILMVAPNIYDEATGKESGNYTGQYMTEECVLKNGVFSTKTIKAFDITVNGDATETTGVSADGHTFNIVNSKYGHTWGSANVKIMMYDANDNLTAVYTYSFPKA